MNVTSLVSSGRRPYLVTIEAKTDGSSATGYPVEDWTALGTVYMARGPLFGSMSGSEAMRGDGQMSARGLDEWTMPYQLDMDPDTIDVPAVRRLRFEARVFDIQTARAEGRRQIVLTTLAKVG